MAGLLRARAEEPFIIVAKYKAELIRGDLMCQYFLVLGTRKEQEQEGQKVLAPRTEAAHCPRGPHTGILPK